MAINDYKRTLLAVNKETNHPFDQPEDMEFLVYETTDGNVKLRVNGSEIGSGGATKKQFIINDAEKWSFEVMTLEETPAFVASFGSFNLQLEEWADLFEADEVVFNNINLTVGTKTVSLNGYKLPLILDAGNSTTEFKRVFGHSLQIPSIMEKADFGSYLIILQDDSGYCADGSITLKING